MLLISGSKHPLGDATTVVSIFTDTWMASHSPQSMFTAFGLTANRLAMVLPDVLTLERISEHYFAVFFQTILSVALHLEAAHPHPYSRRRSHTSIPPHLSTTTTTAQTSLSNWAPPPPPPPLPYHIPPPCGCGCAPGWQERRSQPYHSPRAVRGQVITPSYPQEAANCRCSSNCAPCHRCRTRMRIRMQ